MGEAISELMYPVIEFSPGHLVIVHDETELRRCTRAGVRRGWYDNLMIVDASLRRWPVTLLRTRADGVVAWLTGRLIADLVFERPETVTLEDVKRRTLGVLERHIDLWDADGQLDERVRAVRRAPDMRHLIDALETGTP